MTLVPATIQVSELALNLLMALTFIALASTAPGRAVRGAGPQSHPAIASPARDTGVETDEIRRMIAKYAQSIDAADTTMASQIWSDSPEVSFHPPSGP